LYVLNVSIFETVNNSTSIEKPKLEK